MNNSILVIDSGVGGLTTLARIRKIMTNVNVIYFADDKFMPYGNKEKIDVAKRICDIIEMYLERISAVVLACNTATGAAVEIVRKVFCLPIIGIEPAVAPALKTSGTVAVLVTPLEAGQNKYLRLVADKSVLTLPRPNLALEIERCLLDHGTIKELCFREKIIKEVNEIKGIVKKAGIEKVVLGCTHYVFLKYAHLFDEFVLFDGNDGVAGRTGFFVNDAGEGGIEIVFSSGDKRKSQIALGLLNELLLFDF